MSQKKPPLTLGQKIVGTVILVVTAPIWFPVLKCLMFYDSIKLRTVAVPIFNKMQEEPFCWFTWHEVKLLSGKKTTNVLSMLHVFSAAGLLEVRCRDPGVMEKLRRRLRRPKSVFPVRGPMLTDDVVFYEFRVRYRGGRRRRAGKAKSSRSQSEPTWQPA